VRRDEPTDQQETGSAVTSRSGQQKELGTAPSVHSHSTFHSLDDDLHLPEAHLLQSKCSGADGLWCHKSTNWKRVPAYIVLIVAFFSVTSLVSGDESSVGLVHNLSR